MATNERSGLKDFISSISTIKGDLSNITAPPFLLASQSTVQFPSYWSENPPLFVAPAKETDPLKRTVLVLKWFLAALKRQQYAGREPSEGVKKPLNAFLGEVFLARWEDEEGTTRIVSEQVSHHPPITACYLWNEQYGVSAEGFACQSITFSGSVNIKQMGYATIHLDKYDEDYLVPLPNVKVSGLLTGTPYPEITGTYSIVSSNGYIADIDFSGKKFLGLAGTKNSFNATVYKGGDDSKKALYTAEGTWSEGFKIRDEQNDTEVESYTYDTAHLPPIQTDSLDQQDPWESRRAWNDTTTALDRGDMQAAADAKSVIEEGQRAMRAEEEKSGQTWDTIFFKNVKEDPIYSKLASGLDTGDDLSKEFGFWKYSFKGTELPSKPYRGNLTPENRKSDGHTDTADATNSTSKLAAGGAAGVGAATAGAAAVDSAATHDQKPEPSSPSSDKFSVQRKPVGGGVSETNGNDVGTRQPTQASGSGNSSSRPKDEVKNPYTMRALDPRVG